MPATVRLHQTVCRARRSGLLWLILLCLAGVVQAASPSVPHYTGQVLYRATKAPAAGVLVEVVEAEDDGKPTDEVLGSTRVGPDGRFVVTLDKTTDGPVALVVSAVSTSAASGGNRREEGYEIKNHHTRLAYLSRPNPAKSNTVYIERRKPGQAPGADNE